MKISSIVVMGLVLVPAFLSAACRPIGGENLLQCEQVH